MISLKQKPKRSIRNLNTGYEVKVTGEKHSAHIMTHVKVLPKGMCVPNMKDVPQLVYEL